MIFYEDDETVEDLRLKTQQFVDEQLEQHTQEEAEPDIGIAIKLKKSTKIADKITQQSIQQPQTSILHRPLSEKMHFQITKHKSFLMNSFTCSRNGLNIMFAQKNGILSSEWTVFNRQNATVLGKIIKKSSIYEVNGENTRLAAVKMDQNRLTAILPAVKNNQTIYIQNNQLSQLFSLSKLSTHKDNLTTLSSLKIEGTVHHDLYELMGFMRSKNNFVLRQSKSEIDLKVFLGKVKEHEYKLSVSENISVFQAFCIAICWLD